MIFRGLADEFGKLTLVVFWGGCYGLQSGG